MAPARAPKVLLFDIGGVCVVSPFQAILDYELSHGIPPGYVNNCISKTKPNGWWHRLERGELAMDATWFAGFNSELHNPTLWREFYASQREKLHLPAEIPPPPTIDGEQLFWEMMGASRAPDPWMFPALKKLKQSGRFIIAALSNTMIFPPGHPFRENISKDDVRSLFDIFISSAHVGLRKPDPPIYELALREVNKFAHENAAGRGKDLGWGEGVNPGEILFLDDIGENLKTAKKIGFGTIKVNLGRAFEAVDQLEEVTGMQLAGDHPRIAVLPKAKL